MIWYILLAKKQRELRAAEALRRSGATVFVPVERVVRRVRSARGTRVLEGQRLLTPGYVFADLPFADCDDIRGVMLINGRPATLTDAAMRPLFEATGRIVGDAARPRTFRVGDLVRMATGPFAGQIVTIGNVRGDKLKVAARLFGTEVAADIKADMVEAV